MSPTSQPPGSGRTADEINDAIRGLWLRAGGQLGAEQRREYEALITEWAAAVREETVKAA